MKNDRWFLTWRYIDVTDITLTNPWKTYSHWYLLLKMYFSSQASPSMQQCYIVWLWRIHSHKTNQRQYIFISLFCSIRINEVYLIRNYILLSIHTEKSHMMLQIPHMLNFLTDSIFYHNVPVMKCLSDSKEDCICCYAARQPPICGIKCLNYTLNNDMKCFTYPKIMAGTNWLGSKQRPTISGECVWFWTTLHTWITKSVKI